MSVRDSVCVCVWVREREREIIEKELLALLPVCCSQNQMHTNKSLVSLQHSYTNYEVTNKVSWQTTDMNLVSFNRSFNLIIQSFNVITFIIPQQNLKFEIHSHQ